jgi:hypothetical protein
MIYLACRFPFAGKPSALLLLGAMSFTSACRTIDGEQAADLKSIDDVCTPGTTFTPMQFPAVKVGDGSQPLNQQAVLIYYASDTPEPFMQWTVDEEILALRRSCNSNQPSVNWLAFTNSYYIGDGTPGSGKAFLMCKGGVASMVAMPASLVSSIEAKRAWLAGTSAADPLTLFEIRVPFPSDQGTDFSNYPLAHPDILRQILGFAGQLFPPSTYTPFLHLKSHGSEQMVLTGLTQDQVNDKTQCQNTIIQQKGITAPLVKYGTAGLAGVSTSQVAQAQPQSAGAQGQLGEVGLGEVGLGEVGLGEVGLGEVGLGEVGLGIGTAGLGVHGLNVSNHFGSPANYVAAALYNAGADTPGQAKMYYGFLMLESCDSNVAAQNLYERIINDTGHIDAFYSAQGTLWYHNLAWDEIFQTWSTGNAVTAKSLQDLLFARAAQINNYFTAPQPGPVPPPGQSPSSSSATRDASGTTPTP